MRAAESLIDLIGNTPLLNISKFAKELLKSEEEANVFAKIEAFNPSGSAKDRAALYMIKDAEEKGLISEGGVIVEPNSGNTGIGLALICANKGYKLILTMPETMSVERRKMLAHMGAELVLTEGSKGMNGAIAKAREIVSKTPGAFMPGQFDNSANARAHRETTGLEILNALDNKVDYFIAGVGTGGTLTGTAEAILAKNPAAKIIAVEPKDSPVLSGGTAGTHGIQGIGAGFVPSILKTELITEIITVETKDAIEASKAAAKKLGLVVGISSGAAIFAAASIAARKEAFGKNIVVLLPDTGERYLSTALFD